MSDSMWPPVGQASLSITNSWSLLKLMSIKSVMPSNHLILCPSLLLLPSIFPSIRVFSNESDIRWTKYWSFSLTISPSNEYSGLVSLTIDRLDLLAVQGTFKNLLQHHSSKASVLRFSAFFMVQLLRESIPRQVDKKSRITEERGVWGSRGGDSGLELSRRRKGKTFFFPLYIP